MQKLSQFSYIIKQIERIRKFTMRVTIPGFDKIPLYDVGIFFIKGLSKGSLTVRASSIAFNFFLALFPTLIFFFTLIPYIPIDNFQNELLNLLKDVLPQNAYISFQTTLEDIILEKRGGLLSIGFITAFYFSTNGINSLMNAFNATFHSFDSRKWISQRLISFFLILIISLLVTIAIVLIVFSQQFFSYLLEQDIIKNDLFYYIITSGKWIIVVLLFFFVISFLYYYAPLKKTRWRFFSAGSSLATLMCIVISLGFSFYVNNFGQYNKLYGSIGTLIVIMLWLYFNSIILLIGFELNASINSAHLKKASKIEPSLIN
ncbi:MAG: hypothetical protein A2046_07980 [Bacteroidetes bacterium GWA2_30_7]|nr:MAG: hypothetical protein A2046_07980 [Bacteroidetes bacterium GWA2_30_7]